MENQIVNAEILTALPEAYLHHLSHGVKTLQKTGPLRLSKLSDTEYCITISDFIHKFTSETGLFFKVTNGPYSSFFFTPDKETLYAITIEKYEGANEFEEQINKLTEIYSYEKARNYHLFQKLIQEDYPNPETPLIETSSLNKYIEKFGDVAGLGFKKIGEWSASAVSYVGEMIESRIEPGEMDPSKKEKLEVIAEKSKAAQSTVTGVATAVATPVIKTGSDIGSKISHDMETSKYSSVRKLNDVAHSSIKAGGAVLGGLWSGLCQFGKAVSTQTSNIWNKKFNSHNIVEVPRNPANEEKPSVPEVAIQEQTKETPTN